MSPAEAAGTPYGAATAPLHAQVLVPVPATTHRAAVLSIFDHGDADVDSAVFIDNLTLTRRTARCLPRGVAPSARAVAITGPTVAATVNTATPTLTGTAATRRATRRR